MDGTLTLAQHDFEAIKRALNLPMNKGILEALQEMPASQRQRVEQAVDDWEYELAGQAEPAHGVQALLAHLQQRGDQLGVLTRNSKRNALKTLDATGLSQFFQEQAVLGRDDAPPKPDPSGIHWLLQHWQGRADQAVMIGDFRFDLEAGRAAGCATVHVDIEGRYCWPELMDLGISNLEELLQALS